MQTKWHIDKTYNRDKSNLQMSKLVKIYLQKKRRDRMIANETVRNKRLNDTEINNYCRTNIFY